MFESILCLVWIVQIALAPKDMCGNSTVDLGAQIMTSSFLESAKAQLFPYIYAIKKEHHVWTVNCIKVISQKPFVQKI